MDPRRSVAGKPYSETVAEGGEWIGVAELRGLGRNKQSNFLFACLSAHPSPADNAIYMPSHKWNFIN